jgi:DNA-binding FadR family transcriptional regulator
MFESSQNETNNDIGINMRRRDRADEKLLRLLADGRYPPQSQLPPEREPAQMLGLSRGALREGLEILEAEGGIWRHVDKGTFVGGRPVEGSTHLGLLSATTSPAEVLEIRLMFEPLIAGLAALRATPAEIEHMQHPLEKSEAARDAAHRDAAHAEEGMRTHIETVRDNLLGLSRAKPKEPAKPRGMGRRRMAGANAEESTEHAE